MLREETFELESELERLRERYEELAAAAAGVPEDSDGQALYAAQAQTIRTHARGVRWARDAHEDDDVAPDWWPDEAVESVTLGGLTGGEFGRLQDRDDLTADDDAAWRVHLIASGTVEAPWQADGAPETATVANVSALPLSLQEWAKTKVDDLSTVGEGNWQPFGALVAEQTPDSTTSSE